MIPFKRILFPVDFSAQSRAVAPFVKAMATSLSSEVAALHVVDLPSSWQRSVETGGESRALEIDRLQAEATATLTHFVADEFAGIKTSLLVSKGDPAQQIAASALEHHADLIMMPTHGYGPFRALLLGSVTAKVLHDVGCPVWTAVHAEQMTSHSPDRWKRVLCALDTDDHGEAVLQWASEFAQKQGLELQVVHAVAGADGMWIEANDPSMYEFLFNAARDQLSKLQKAAGTNFEIRLLGGSAGNAVRKAAVDYDADVILIGRGGMHTSFGRLKDSGYSIIRSAPCPVISV